MNAANPATPLVNGLLVLHGNRIEELAAAVFGHLARQPLAPLEEEHFLVPSHAMAEWLKMTLAEQQGISAALRVELPARFAWRAYRAVLGPEAVPRSSPLDKQPLAWRLMGLLPKLAGHGDLAGTGRAAPGFEPVAAFLADGSALRRWQLAQQIADLFDQYQVYRSDWLQDWAAGRERLRGAEAAEGPAGAASQPLPEALRWQARLWQALLQALPAEQRRGTRAALHERFVAALRDAASRQAAGAAPPQLPLWSEEPGDTRPWPALPRRLVLFGTTHIPHATLDALAALAAHVQVLIAVPNPCRYDWADIVDGHELLRAERRRHGRRPGAPAADAGEQGHPLLATWGRQARDFVRQLDAFDDVQRMQRELDVPRVDLYDESETFDGAATLLQRVQLAIRELMPLAEHPGGGVAPDDRSIVFHGAHSAQREVEVLHDQLLHLLAQGAPPAQRGQRALAPRDIVVMVPDIEAFAPAIRAVFGGYPRGDARFIPWGIADRRARRAHPLLAALESLLHLQGHRFTATQLAELLHLSAVGARLGIDGDAADQLVTWAEGAGIRWGLDGGQRAALGFEACGEANSWRFGLDRMLMGYATGELGEEESPRAGLGGIAPFAEVAGIEAGLAGALAELHGVLAAWWRDARVPRPPAAWAERLRSLLAALFSASDDAERSLLAALDGALASWLAACDEAAFDEPVPLEVAREAWFAVLEEPGAAQRFKAGGVTFCTLLPLRSLPFEVVCLLGMNDGDYPRRGARNDFDLMALPGLARAGDRSRRDDDRQLMLDALLAARRVFYVSWASRSQRNNEPQPPSVLVAQLREYLERGFGEGVLAARTTEHPLQPFSRRYFERGGAAAPGAPPLFTYAREWRAAHADVGAGAGASPSPSAGPSASPNTNTNTNVSVNVSASAGVKAAAAEADGTVLTIDELARFLRNPVKAWFQRQLQVRFDDIDLAGEDDEPLLPAGLERWRWVDDVLRAVQRRVLGAVAGGDAAAEARLFQRLDAELAAQLAQLAREGRLPLAGPGRHQQAELHATLAPMLQAWLGHRAAAGEESEALACSVAAAAGLVLQDRIGGPGELRRAPVQAGAGGEPALLRLVLRPDRLLDGAEPEGGRNRRESPALRADKVHAAWLAALAAGCGGVSLRTVLIGSDAVVTLAPPPAAQARRQLCALLLAWRDAVLAPRPWPTAMLTGLAALREGGRPRDVYESSRPAGTGRATGKRTEGQDPYLARLYPDYAALTADAAAFDEATRTLYGDYAAALQQLLTIETLSGGAIAVAGAGAGAGAAAEEATP